MLRRVSMNAGFVLAIFFGGNTTVAAVGSSSLAAISLYSENSCEYHDRKQKA